MAAPETEGGAALGLRFVGAALPGLVAGVEDELPSVACELASEAELDERWGRATAPELIFDRSNRDGTPFLRIERDASSGYRVWARGYGTHLVSINGEECSSGLLPGPAWRGLRLLASQVMPLVATLRGREVMHAAGVVLGGRLVGLVAPSGTGKSSTAGNLIAHGGSFFADDVLALDVVDGRVRGHPGPRLVNVRAHDLAAIPEALHSRIGVRLDESDKVHLEPVGYPGALPLDEHPRIEFMHGSSTSPEIVERVRAAVDDADGPVMVILDGDHSRDHVARELELYGPLVTPGSLLLSQDGVIDDLELFRDSRPGPRPANRDFLARHPEFEHDRERTERFLLTHHPLGWMKKLR